MSGEEIAASGERRMASGERLFSFLVSRLSPLFSAYWIAKGVGWDNVLRRLYQSAMLRSGALKRKLSHISQQQSRARTRQQTQLQILKSWKDRRRKFFETPKAEDLRELIVGDLWEQNVTSICTEATNGNYPFFSRWTGELGWPPNFNLDPINKLDWPVGEHWLKTAKSGPPRNDIKLVWEASRFSLAFFLARDYAYRSKSETAQYFWEMFDAWIVQNPINQSVAWGCGQEIAFRLMAMLTGAFTMLDNPHSTPDRLASLQELCWCYAMRIEANINYAISQENNHALSEAAGLWTIGLLFGEFAESDRWIRKAQHIIETEVQRQIYSDGSYVQHSMTYHRVMLDVMVWVIELGRRNNRELSKATLDRVASATRWLGELVDPNTGRVPNYGANDGANVLPLACCDYLDFRPILHTASVSLNVPCDLPMGAWCEKSIWLVGTDGGRQKTIEVAASSNWAAPIGGYYALRGPNSKLFTRATKYRDRPSQCDMLHVDLWMMGHNIFRDAGSYRYYHQDPSIKKYFYSVEAHNTIQVAGQEQMTKGPNFLWFHWSEGSARFVGENRLDCKATFTGPVPYTHHRVIMRDGDQYRIQDRVEGADFFTARWHLAPELTWIETDLNCFQAKVGSDGIVSVHVHGDEAFRSSLVKGWESLYYAERIEIPVIEVHNAQGTLSTTVEWLTEPSCSE